MSLDAPAASPARNCFPRVSGDEPYLVPNRVNHATFSPRERG